jgi:hypothetical protein
MRNLYLVAVAATVWLGACTTDTGFTIKCTINGETKEFTTSPGKDDCDKIRASLTTAATVPAKEAPIFANPAVYPHNAGYLEQTTRSQRQQGGVSRPLQGVGRGDLGLRADP